MKTAMLIIVVLMILAVSVKVEGDTLCDTGIEYVVEYRDINGVNAMLVIDAETGVIYIGALDYNKDGIYDWLVFDTDGDGMSNYQLSDGQATLEMVLWLYCKYCNFEMS